MVRLLLTPTAWRAVEIRQQIGVVDGSPKTLDAGGSSVVIFELRVNQPVQLTSTGSTLLRRIIHDIEYPFDRDGLHLATLTLIGSDRTRDFLMQLMQSILELYRRRNVSLRHNRCHILDAHIHSTNNQSQSQKDGLHCRLS